MPRLTPENVALAREIIGRYPRPRSAAIPLLHLAQEQDGHLTDEAMAHVAELVGATPAEILGVASFYEMFKRRPVGRYLVNVCTNISCQLLGAEEVLGVPPGGTTQDGMFTLEDAECLAACTDAPCLQVNYRYRNRVTHEDFDRLVEDLRAGRLDDEIPPHGTLHRIRQRIPAGRSAGVALPDDGTEPVWLAAGRPALADGDGDGGDGPGRREGSA